MNLSRLFLLQAEMEHILLMILNIQLDMAKLSEKNTSTLQALNCKRLVVSQRRYERACERLADANVTFCEKGAAANKVKPYFCTKKHGEPKEPPRCG